MDLDKVSEEIANLLAAIFLRDENGLRPVFGGAAKFQEDSHWRDYLLFYEYFHGDNGAGIGASHQTWWTGIIAWAIPLFAYLEPEQMLAGGWRQLGYRMGVDTSQDFGEASRVAREE